MNFLAWLSSLVLSDIACLRLLGLCEGLLKGYENRDFIGRKGANHHAFGIFSRPMAKNESPRGDGGDI